MVNYPGDALKKGAKELLETGIFSDLTIKAGDREFKVHKAILFPQSNYFRKLLGPNFQEANTNEITLPEDENVIQALIFHLYHFGWDTSARGTTSDAVFCVHVYQVADKYDVPSLRQLAATRFRDALDAINDVPAFVDAIYAVDDCCNPSDRTLWDVVLPLIKENMKHLLSFDSFKTLIKEKDELNFLLLSEMAGGMPTATEGDGEDPDEDAWGGRRLGGHPRARPVGSYSVAFHDRT